MEKNKGKDTKVREKIDTSALAETKRKWDILFSDKNQRERAYSALGYAYTNNPYVQNQRVKQVTSQPFSARRESLSKALASPQENEQLLRQTSQSLFVNYPLMKLNNMYANLLTYRNYFYSKYTNRDDIASKEYKEERKRISQWCEQLQPKRTFQNIVLRLQKEGKCAFYIRDSVTEKKYYDYVYLQDIPSDYFKIVGWNTASNYTVSFDFTYFWQMGTSPEQFPPIFQKYFKELNCIIPDKGNGILQHDPRTLPKDTEIYYQDNEWFYWKTLPLDECFVFSQDETVPWQLPNTIGLFLQAEDLQDYAYVQQEILKLQTSGVIMGTMPLNKDTGATVGTDYYALGSDAFTFFTEMFNNAAPAGIQMFLNPATDFKFFTFDNQSANNSIILTNALQQFNATAGIGGLNPTTDKPNMAQVKTQQTLESAYVEKLYKQFERCINIWWKNKLDLRYDWRFKIKGSRFQDEVDFNKVEKGITLGQNYLLPEYLSFFDLTLDDSISLQAEVIGSKVYDNFRVLQSSYNAKADEGSGRPRADENAIESDGTASSIQQGNNTSEGRIMSLQYCVECGEKLNNSSVYPFCSVECEEENLERVGSNNE